MSRSVVGLLAAAGAIMAALVGLVHGDFVPAVIACTGTATGLAAYLALPGQKNFVSGVVVLVTVLRRWLVIALPRSLPTPPFCRQWQLPLARLRGLHPHAAKKWS